MKGWKRWAGPCGLALVWALSAEAQPLEACRDDIASLCSEAPPGRRGVASCLQEQREALSPECLAQLDAQRAQRRRSHARREACLEDVDRFCAEIDSPRQRVACLRQHRDEVSAECRDALPGPPGP